MSSYTSSRIICVVVKLYTSFYRNSNGFQDISTISSLYSMDIQRFKGYRCESDIALFAIFEITLAGPLPLTVKYNKLAWEHNFNCTLK